MVQNLIAVAIRITSLACQTASHTYKKHSPVSQFLGFLRKKSIFIFIKPINRRTLREEHFGRSCIYLPGSQRKSLYLLK